MYAEEFGLLNLILLALYLLVIGRGLMIAAKATTLFGRLMAGSITLSFSPTPSSIWAWWPASLPVVGVPLPLISYGGTAMVTPADRFWHSDEHSQEPAADQAVRTGRAL